MRVADLQLSFPPILLALILLAFLRPGLGNIVIALVAVQWAYYARTTRSAALVERRKEYIEAATCLGLPPGADHVPPPAAELPAAADRDRRRCRWRRPSRWRPRCRSSGLACRSPEPSLGSLISNGQRYMLSGKYWISFFPGASRWWSTIVVDEPRRPTSLRDVLNPRLQTQ